MTIWRIYENDRPLATKHFLPWSAAGAAENEPVFTSGHPGQTQRLNTVAHLAFLRDYGLPFSLSYYTEMRNALDAYGKQGAEQQRQASDEFFSLENSLKSWKGQLAGLQSAALMDKKRAAERTLAALVDANADLKAKYGDAWDVIATGRNNLVAYNMERLYFEVGLNSQYFSTARTLMRWADESAKPNGQRLPEYTDARRPQIEKQLTSAAPVYPALEQAKLTAALTAMQKQFGPDHSLVKVILAGQSPAARAAGLVSATALGDVATRKALLSGGKAAIDASSDPMIALAKLVEPRARELRTKYDNEVLGAERDGYAKIAQAIFATQGESAYPTARSRCACRMDA